MFYNKGDIMLKMNKTNFKTEDEFVEYVKNLSSNEIIEMDFYLRVIEGTLKATTKEEAKEIFISGLPDRFTQHQYGLLIKNVLDEETRIKLQNKIRELYNIK